MVRAIAATVATLSILGLGACAETPDQRPLIVVTTNILGDVITQVVGSEADVVTLMQPNADPHSFEISASQAARMQRADLLVSNGLGLEEGLQQHLDAAAQAGVARFTAGEAADTIPYETEQGAGGRPTVDPHFWTDPTQMIAVVEAASNAIVANVDGVNEHEIRRSAAEYTAELTQLDQHMASAFAAIEPARRNLVTNHHVFGYLAERYGFSIVGAVVPGGSTLAAPSASDLRDLVGAIESAGVRTIFADSSHPDRLMQVLADEAQLQVAVVPLFTESLTEPGGEAASYLAMMRANTHRISTGLAQPRASHNQ